MLASDAAMLKSLGEAEDYESLNSRLKEVAFVRLASIRSKDIDQEKRPLSQQSGTE